MGIIYLLICATGEQDRETFPRCVRFLEKTFALIQRYIYTYIYIVQVESQKECRVIMQTI